MLKNNIKYVAGMLLATVFLSACGEEQNAPAEGAVADNEAQESSDAKSTHDEESNMNEIVSAISQTGWTDAVPTSYRSAASKQGSITQIDYASKDYVNDSSPITKTAYVYTPYGYDEKDSETKYDIIYLMHGWGGHHPVPMHRSHRRGNSFHLRGLAHGR